MVRGKDETRHVWTFARQKPEAIVRGTFVNRMPPKDKGWSEVRACGLVAKYGIL